MSARGKTFTGGEGPLEEMPAEGGGRWLWPRPDVQNADALLALEYWRFIIEPVIVSSCSSGAEGSPMGGRLWAPSELGAWVRRCGG